MIARGPRPPAMFQSVEPHGGLARRGARPGRAVPGPVRPRPGGGVKPLRVRPASSRHGQDHHGRGHHCPPGRSYHFVRRNFVYRHGPPHFILADRIQADIRLAQPGQRLHGLAAFPLRLEDQVQPVAGHGRTRMGVQRPAQQRVQHVPLPHQHVLEVVRAAGVEDGLHLLPRDGNGHRMLRLALLQPDPRLLKGGGPVGRFVFALICHGTA